jgi:putative toxin-antitoxin system antitoxin component (TIGR02293 family)
MTAATQNNVRPMPYPSFQVHLEDSAHRAFGHSVAEIKEIITIQQTEALEEALNKILISTIVDHICTLLAIPQKEALELIGTNASQKSRNKTANREIADRSFIVFTVFARIAAKMGNERARNWIKSPKKALNNAVPLELLNTRVGLQELENYLTALEDGSYS